MISKQFKKVFYKTDRTVSKRHFSVGFMDRFLKILNTKSQRPKIKKNEHSRQNTSTELREERKEKNSVPGNSNLKKERSVYGGPELHGSISRAEIIFSRNSLDYSEFKTSLLDPTIVNPENLLKLPKPEHLPGNIPSHRTMPVSYNRCQWVFPPKPLQEAHEHFLFSSTLRKGGEKEILSPRDRFSLHIDNTFTKISRALSGDDLVEILRKDWLRPEPIFSSPVESLRRTLEVFLQLGQIKQFAFLSSNKLDPFLEEIVSFCKTNIKYLTNDQLTDIFWVFAKVGARPASIVDQLTERIETKLSEFNMIQLGDLFYSFEELRIDSRKLFVTVESCIVEKSPRNLKELSPTQLFQLAYATSIGIKPQNMRKNMFWHICYQIHKVWRSKPFIPLYSMLQICRFTTVTNMYFPGDKFKGLIPNDLREKALFLFKSGRAEMYSPPFLDPMCREVLSAYATTMKFSEKPTSIGLNGWWLWAFQRRQPFFSVEPASKVWYTRLDNEKRMLGSNILRNRIIEHHGLYTLHIPFYEWETLSTFRARYQYIHRQMADQLGITHFFKETKTFSNMFNIFVNNRDPKTYDLEIKPDREIAWDWEELCAINVRQNINPNNYINGTSFRLPLAVYNDDERFKKPDYWNE